MIRHLWTVFCSQSLTDSESNNVSLVNVLERLQVGIPEQAVTRGKWVVPMRCEVVTLWERGVLLNPSQGVARIEIIDSTGQMLGSGEVGIDLSAHVRCRSRLAFSGFPVTDSGRYVIRTSLVENGVEPPHVVNEYPVEVSVQVGNQTEPAEPEP